MIACDVSPVAMFFVKHLPLEFDSSILIFVWLATTSVFTFTMVFAFSKHCFYKTLVFTVYFTFTMVFAFAKYCFCKTSTAERLSSFFIRLATTLLYIQCILYSIKCTMYNIQCMSYSIYNSAR